MSDSDCSEAESTDEISEPGPPIVCLFCGSTEDEMPHMFKHLSSSHNFNAQDFLTKVIRSTYDQIKVVTYIRRERPTVEGLVESRGRKPWDSEAYLKPTDPEDPWLWTHFDFLEEEEEEESKAEEPPKYVNSENGLVTLSKEHFHQLQAKLSEAERLLSEREGQIGRLRELINEQDTSTPRKERGDAGYFASYACHEIHREMLSDQPRMEAFGSLFANTDFFRDKNVLDVGCGTGILSMMAATAGANSVTGVDDSDILYTALEIVSENSLDSKIKLIKTRLEELQTEQKFEVIVSEWMGYFLLFENMLPSVLNARDRFLAKDGHVFPSSCRLYLQGVSDVASHRKRTRDEYSGYRMSSLRRTALVEPLIETVPTECLATQPALLYSLDILTAQQTDCLFSSDFTLPVSRDTACELTGLCSYFECGFLPVSPSVLSTSPTAPPTHWKQTVFYLDQPLHVRQGDHIKGRISVEKDETHSRNLHITISLNGGEGQYFIMESSS